MSPGRPTAVRAAFVRARLTRRTDEEMKEHSSSSSPSSRGEDAVFEVERWRRKKG